MMRPLYVGLARVASLRGWATKGNPFVLAHRLVYGAFVGIISRMPEHVLKLLAPATAPTKELPYPFGCVDKPEQPATTNRLTESEKATTKAFFAYRKRAATSAEKREKTPLQDRMQSGDI